MNFNRRDTLSAIIGWSAHYWGMYALGLVGMVVETIHNDLAR